MDKITPVLTPSFAGRVQVSVLAPQLSAEVLGKSIPTLVMQGGEHVQSLDEIEYSFQFSVMTRNGDDGGLYI